jgi:hypothetical protein
MARSTRVALFALAAIGAFVFDCDPDSDGVGVSAAHADEPKPNANDCMSFENDVQEKAIVVHASNACERKLSCSLTYVVRCEDNAGKQTSSTNGRAHFSLASRGAAEVPMSAEQCKQGWSIDDVSWLCR